MFFLHQEQLFHLLKEPEHKLVPIQREVQIGFLGDLQYFSNPLLKVLQEENKENEIGKDL